MTFLVGLRRLLNRQRRPSKEQVIRWAHELGMHKGVLDSACEACFDEGFDRYIGLCFEILDAIGASDQKDGCEAYLCKFATDMPTGRIMLLHEHPAYTVANYLGLDHDDPLFREIIRKTTAISARTHD